MKRIQLGSDGIRRLAAYFALLLALVTTASLSSLGSANSGTQLTRPNIILILSDDQSYESIYKMPYLRSRIPPQGGWYRFDNAFINNATCCPSRATIMTGRWSHHHGVEATGGAVPYDDSDTIATRLHAAGYRTGFVGKYHLSSTVNDGAGPTYIPPGWDRWQAFASNTRGWYYDYSLNENGTLVDYGSAPADYSTDVLRRKALSFINGGGSKPFLLVYAPRAPHNNWDAAPRHLGHYKNEPVEHPPNFNEADMSDKPAWWRALRALRVDDIDAARREEWDTTLALDDAVRAIHQRVHNLGLMSRTVIFFMTDNGYAFGEHRYTGKVCAYEECSQTPLLVKYGGHGEGRTFPQLVGNEDLAPTLADLAGVSPPQPSDGQSFAPMLRAGTSPPNWANAILLHGYDAGEKDGDRRGHPPTFWGLRTPRYKYIETVRTGEVELYHLAADPYELNNIAKRPSYAGVRAKLADRLHRLALRGTTIAGRVSVDATGSLIFDAGPGAKNVVSVGAGGGSWLPTDLAAPIAAGARCRQIRVARVSCLQADVSRVVLQGEDRIDILDGPDRVRATLDGGVGDDRLTAGSHRDHVVGGDGRDVLEGGPAPDRLLGGRGNDTIHASGDGAADEIDCGDGTDVVYADPIDVFPTTGPGACEIVR